MTALTPNRMGWEAQELNAVSLVFVDFCAPDVTALDIGAGEGLASRAAVAAGARVFANDLRTVEIFGAISKPGRFPRDIAFDPESLDAVHSSSVFHFLNGKDLARGFRLIARWLRPGGKLFVHAASPYQAPFADFVPEYERRVAAGEPWPGWVPKIARYSAHRKLGQMPGSIHLLDDRVLRREAEAAGLAVERAFLYRRDDLPRSLHLDGRECAGLIARKDACKAS
ncbi:MAG: class I SAM-dependent methyltransferase [Bryobacteraceae bacterium]|nr:class I SAM-dependent methyltransferase [Bryobacteraceae bacterium]